MCNGSLWLHLQNKKTKTKQIKQQNLEREKYKKVCIHKLTREQPAPPPPWHELRTWPQGPRCPRTDCTW